MFKLNNFDFSLLPFSTVSKPVSSVPAPLSFAIAWRSSSYVSALSHKSLSDPTNVCDGTNCSSNVYPSKPFRPSKPVFLSNVRPSKPIISSNFYLSKPVCPRNIISSRCIYSSAVCQNPTNVIASKPICPIGVCPSKPVRPSNVIPSIPVRQSNSCLSKTARPSKVHSSKPVCPSDICPNKPVSLSNICLSKPARATAVFPRKPVLPINVCPNKPVRPSNVYSSKPVCPSNDCPSKPVSLINVCLQSLRLVIKTLIFDLFIVFLFFSTYSKLSIVTLNIFNNLILLKVIFLTNFTWWRKCVNGLHLRSFLDVVIIFQSYRTILKISISNVSKQKSEKKVKFFLLFLICMTFVFLKYKNSSDFFNDVNLYQMRIFYVWVYKFWLLEWIALH